MGKRQIKKGIEDAYLLRYEQLKLEKGDGSALLRLSRQVEADSMSTQAGVELRLVQKRLKRKLAQARKRRDTEEADPIAWAVPAEALGDGELVLSLEDVPVRKELDAECPRPAAALPTLSDLINSDLLGAEVDD